MVPRIKILVQLFMKLPPGAFSFQASHCKGKRVGGAVDMKVVGGRKCTAISAIQVEHWMVMLEGQGGGGGGGALSIQEKHSMKREGGHARGHALFFQRVTA